MSDVRELMKEVELVAIRPLAMLARLSPGPSPKQGANFENQFNVRIGFTRAGELEFFVIFKVDCQSKLTPADRAFARYAYQVAVQYRAPRAWSDEIINQFATLNTPVHAWPYARQFVHSASVQLGLSPTLLPAFRSGQPPAGTQPLSTDSGSAKVGVKKRKKNGG